MITKHSHSTVWVLDQDRAKAFYTEKLGLEVRTDATMGSFRWLTVGPKTQPDHQLVLMALKPFGHMKEEHVAALRMLLDAGVLGGGVLDTDDCRRDYEELSAKGVTFDSEPKEMPYGVEAVMRDDSGNYFSLTQRR